MSDQLDAHDDSAPTSTAGYLTCPVCGDEIPIGLSSPRMSRIDGRPVMTVHLQPDDVWAHAWTHGIEPR